MEGSNMSLTKPNLDDKKFFRIVEEARALIPSRAPEWTDHNVHDPGITFIELFSWLVEIQHYRMNRVSDESFQRFFSLIGLARRSRRPAEVTVSFDFPLKKGRFIPAGTRVAPISVDDLPFETIEDFFLTHVHLAEVITYAGGRAIRQTLAEDNIAGHYEAFGLAPMPGDSLCWGFDSWFAEEETRLSITLFEDDLPPRIPLPAGEPGFVPSARLKWEFHTKNGWAPLDLIADTTLHLSRSGDLIFRATKTEAVKIEGAERLRGLFGIRATLAEGSYEIPPRIAAIRTNSIRARQVETIVNEEHGRGLGTPDQTVRLKKEPVLVDPAPNGGPFLAGEVLDWKALIYRLADPHKYVPPNQEELVAYVVRQLGDEAKSILDNRLISKPGTKAPAGSQEQASLLDSAMYSLAQSFNKLLENPGFYDRRIFGEKPENGAKSEKDKKGKHPERRAFPVPSEFADLAAGRATDCLRTEQLRQFNRLLLQWVFPDLLLSDRVEIQTGTPVSKVEDEPMSWISWTPVTDFLRSGPTDFHYILDPETGVICFGNGFNGRVPPVTEHIRARFYRHTRGDVGNVPTGLKWSLFLSSAGHQKCPGNPPESGSMGDNFNPGEGGALPESIDEAQLRSRKLFHTQQRLLTAEDYELQTLQTPGLRVSRAKAMPNHNPNLPKIPYPGDVTVVVVPEPLPGAIKPGVEPPSPSQGFRDTIRNFLNSRRIVTANVHVVGPKWVQINVSASVILMKGAAAKDVHDRLLAKLNEFLDPLRGGPDRGKGWPFGRAVFPSEIYQLLAQDPDVEYATDVTLDVTPTNQSGQVESVTFSLRDFKDLSSFAAKLKNGADAVAKYIRSRLSDSTRQKLAEWSEDIVLPASLRRDSIAELNSIVLGASIWDEERFAKVEPRQQVRDILARNPEGADRARLNRLLLEDAYPLEIARTRRLRPTGLPCPGVHTLLMIPFETMGQATTMSPPKPGSGGRCHA
jgi:hypothetical protein